MMKKKYISFLFLGIICLLSSNIVIFSNQQLYRPANVRISALDESVLIGKNVGWIISHGEDDNSTYSFTINDLKSFGAQFSLINTPITSGLLSSYNIVVIEEGGTNWAPNELTALKAWIETGGAVYILGDQPGFSQGNVSQYFNVYYNVSMALNGLLTISDPGHPVFENVATIDSAFATASIDESLSTDALKVLAMSRDNQSLIAALLVNEGRILWNVNSDGIINDFSLDIDDNRKFANNSWIWLATPNPYTGNGPSDTDNLLIPIIIASSIAVVAIVIVIVVWKKKKKVSLKLEKEEI